MQPATTRERRDGRDGYDRGYIPLRDGTRREQRSKIIRFAKYVRDPFNFAKWLWPHVKFYREQRQVISSVIHNGETVVVAGNKLGKDFVAGFICLHAFLTNREARIITTSVKDDHLRVLWGEIGRFIRESRVPLTVDKGGPLLVNHRDIRKVISSVSNPKQAKKELCPISYLRGMVSERGEGMAGHHAPFALFVADEASGIDDYVYTQADTWATRKLIFGNPNPCNNFFFRFVEEGDLLDKEDAEIEMEIPDAK